MAIARNITKTIITIGKQIFKNKNRFKEILFCFIYDHPQIAFNNIEKLRSILTIK